ncbi:MAG: RIP metalloprotease RseP [candidate division Zixibacteria bacterium]|nr:RIP metalloprotease RseP [Candidatus Tariuqbacter arcticus]
MISILSLIITLFVVVIVHEFGHFIAAKLVGIRVESFSLGFPPKLIGKKIGETEYMISAIPLGGYVKMAGMIDESLSDKPLTGAPWEFMSKSYSQKIFAITAGVLMNFILACVLYTGLTMNRGVGEISTPAVAASVDLSESAAIAGLESGDRIIKIDGEPVDTWCQMQNTIRSRPKSNVEVVWLRDDEEMSAIVSNSRRFLFSIQKPSAPANVGSVSPGMPADSAGILPGDLIVKINGDSVAGWYDMASRIYSLPDTEVEVVWVREGETMSAILHTATQKILQDWKMIDGGMIGIGAKMERRKTGIIESVSKGAQYTFFAGASTVMGIYMLATGEAGIKDFVGPLGIAHYSGESMRIGFAAFIGFIAFVSANIGLLNILPIPVLDGGHLVFITVEAVIRRPISSKVKLVIQQVGMALLLLFMIIISYNDLMRFLIK